LNVLRISIRAFLLPEKTRETNGEMLVIIREEYALWYATEEGERLVDWISKAAGGRATVRQVLHAFRHRFDDAATVECVLEWLRVLGRGRWTLRESGPKGGRPTIAFDTTKPVENIDA
jgi:hypothetical protein